ncbi:MAG: EAL domain-containing protein [Pseudomonadales bacterium]|nr:EAL domain-containing protein [Pseudomonadales bacterium]
MAWVSRLNQALDEGRLELRCQMIAPLSAEAELDGLHYEILLSMQNDDGSLISPGEFMQAAERYNRMQAVDRWVIENVLRWMAVNPEKLAMLGGFSINLSGHSLNDEGLMEFIFQQFSQYDVQRSKLCFEVTETTAIANLADAADFIREMKRIGCKFALDDFGAGMSSYAYLKNLPVDFIKIDGSFIKNLDKDKADYAMVKSIHEMAKLLGKATIAEYVENQAILECLREIGVDFVQGYEIEKPRLLSGL